MSEVKTIDIPAEVVSQTQAVAVQQQGGALAQPQSQPTQAAAPITPAQAKVDAIAALTMKAYDRAATLQITPEEAARLSADFPDEAFKPGAAGKEHLLYIEHAFLRDRLCEVFGLGQWVIVPRNRWAEPFTTGKGTPGERVYVEAMLIIRGCFVGEAIGAMEYYPKNESQNYSDACEGAKTAAFRRCAKELGVGLQAWKKDWCDGWWARKRGGRDFSHNRESSQNAPGRTGSASPPPRQAPGAQSATQAKPSAETPSKAPSPEVKTPSPAKFPTETTKKWALDEIAKAVSDIPGLEEYMRAVNILLPTETLIDIDLRWVPASRSELKRLLGCFQAFVSGDPAELPYQAHVDTSKPPPKPDKPKASPATTAAASKDPEYWRDVIIPIPPKGWTRAQYMQNPDTIGSLYEMRHEQTADGQAARQRLWGMVEHYEPKPWTKKNGEVVPPSQADHDFRKALDDLADFLEKHGEKL